MEVLKEKDMKLLSRKRLYLKYEHQGKSTPSREELLKEVAKQFKAKEELVIIKHIYPQFGENWSKVVVNIYDNEKKMKLFEHLNLLKKHEEKPKATEAKSEGGEN